MKRTVTILVLFTFACTTPPIGPALAGVIQGVVFDNSGAPLPGVVVTIDGNGRNIVTVTNAEGKYRVAGMAPGRYRVAAALPGFGMTQHPNVVVAANKGAALVLTMNPAAVSQTITVTASAPAEQWVRGRGVAALPPARLSVNYDAAPLPDPQYAQFEDHGFVDAAKERVTTFAIDVDRASYANVRRFLTSGLVPPRDAVRIEEMINYFTYSYPQPSGSTPFSITTEVTGCPWNTQNRLLRIGIQGRNLEQWKMAPNNLVFLLDVSGSMEPLDRLPLIKQAFRVLVDQLRAEDRVAIVVYAGAAGLVLPPTSGADKAAILGALDSLQAGGSTAGGAGIELAYKVAQDHFLRGGNNRVILATDGDFNIGIRSNVDLEKLIEEKRKSGIFLSTIGVGGSNFQDARMELLADKGNGNYAFLDTLKEAEKVFRQELTGTLVTIAKDVKVQLDFDPSLVASYRQIGYENRALANKDFDDDTKDAGELGAGHSVTALYELVPASNARGTIATIKLRYKAPDGETSALITASAVDEGKSVYDASADMQFAAAVAELGMLLRDSPHKGTANYADVQQLARISRGADLEGLREEFVRLIDSASMITSKRVAAK